MLLSERLPQSSDCSLRVKTLVMAELKQQAASNDLSEPSKRLPFLDKQNLLAAQKNRIVGLSHKGEQLPSRSPIDAAYSIMLLLFEKDGCLISKAVQKICLLSKQISACVLAKCV